MKIYGSVAGFTSLCEIQHTVLSTHRLQYRQSRALTLAGTEDFFLFQMSKPVLGRTHPPFNRDQCSFPWDNVAEV
jgi:hypothetical protein